MEITNFWMGPTMLTFLGIKTVASFPFDDLIISPYFILFYLFFLYFKRLLGIGCL